MRAAPPSLGFACPWNFPSWLRPESCSVKCFLPRGTPLPPRPRARAWAAVCRRASAGLWAGASCPHLPGRRVGGALYRELCVARGHFAAQAWTWPRAAARVCGFSGRGEQCEHTQCYGPGRPGRPPGVGPEQSPHLSRAAMWGPSQRPAPPACVIGGPLVGMERSDEHKVGSCSALGGRTGGGRGDDCHGAAVTTHSPRCARPGRRRCPRAHARGQLRDARVRVTVCSHQASPWGGGG